jgi:hypothetical protein
LLWSGTCAGSEAWLDDENTINVLEDRAHPPCFSATADVVIAFPVLVQGAEQGEPGNNADLLIVVGAGGEASYGEMFLEWATMLRGGRRGSPSQS